MKKYLIFALIVMLFVGCSKKRNITLLNSSDFETVIDGKGVSLYTLKSGFLTMQVTNYGGRWCRYGCLTTVGVTMMWFLDMRISIVMSIMRVSGF